MASQNNELLVITIVIQTHGKTITYELNSRTSKIFENTRLLCQAGGFVDYESTPYQEFFLVEDLQDYFTRDLSSSTYDIISKTEKGIIVDNITFDKSLSTTINDPTLLDYVSPITNMHGIYLLSIHNGKRLIYPDNPKGKILNLMKINDLTILAEKFNTSVPNIQQLSTPFPRHNIYMDEEIRVKNDSTILEDEKNKVIKGIRQQFYNNISNWRLTSERNQIISIKLSTLVELVKIIIGSPCFINLLDYSCNSATMYIPKEQQLSAQYALKTGDIEYGLGSRYGGRKRENNIKRRKQTKRTKRKKRTKRFTVKRKRNS